MKLIENILFLLMLLNNANANEVILCAGIGNYTHEQLWKQYTAFNTYSSKKIITGSSILLYNIDTNGFLCPYETNDNVWNGEIYQQYIKNNTGLKSYPTVYCDCTIGMCTNFNERIEKTYLNIDYFITDTINKALKYNYDGYMIDFEPDTQVNSTLLTDFILKWNSALNIYNMNLILWIGGDTVFDNRIFNSTLKLKLCTMETYDNDYNTFISNADALQVNINNVSNLGFGLLTNYGLFQNSNLKKYLITNDIKDTPIDPINLYEIINWLKLSNTFLSLWTSHIHPLWHLPLYNFVNTQV